MTDHIRTRHGIEEIRGLDQLWRAVDSPLLTPDERKVIKLKIIEDMTHEEIAQTFPCSERTVQRIYKKALRKLGNALL